MKNVHIYGGLFLSAYGMLICSMYLLPDLRTVRSKHIWRGAGGGACNFMSLIYKIDGSI